MLSIKLISRQSTAFINLLNPKFYLQKIWISYKWNPDSFWFSKVFIFDAQGN